jgi:ADP-ribose pyrophosphatase
MSDAEKKITLHETNLLFKGFFEFNEVKFTHSLYNGETSNLLSREIFNRNQAVVVLLYDLKKQKVILVEQIRAGALRNALQADNIEHAWLLEPVAGMIDFGETAKQAAKRETLEETGLKLNELEYICQFYPSPGACDEVLHLYAAEVDSQIVSPFAGNNHEGEDIKVVSLSFADAKQRLLKGQFNVASTFISLQWLFFQKLATTKQTTNDSIVGTK